MLDMLLIVRDGRNLSLPASSSDPHHVSENESVNPYLVYKVSPDISPAATHSQISWQCKNPQFVFHKVHKLKKNSLYSEKLIGCVTAPD